MTANPYELNTGLTGFLTLWVGLFAQASTIVLLAGLSGTSAQPVGVALAAYFISMVIYFLIDVAWVFGLEMRILNYFFDSNYFDRPTLQRAVLLPTFFVFAAAANTFVIILPSLDSIDQDSSFSYWGVALRGFTMGWFAYGNLALVQAWSYKGYPLEIVGIMPLSGGALSMITSLLTTYLCEQVL